ncbi:MAG: phosphotransferase [Proteobacteria bacterium]|nr:phosphotransferase [Pseudomonadota bacterium]
MQVRDAHRIDSDALDRYMADHIDGYRGPIEVEQFRGGQSNPTYRVAAASGRYVVRRKPPGKLLPSAHAVDREYRVLAALAGTDVPTPRVFALCEDPAVIGTPFYVMEYVEGRVYWELWLPDCEPAFRTAVFDSMNDGIAKLHRVDYRAVGLDDFGKPGQYVARQIARWSKQYRASETEVIPEMDRLIEWLPAHLPEEDETTLVHGDYRLDNMIFDQTEPRLLAILDWEISTLGHPVADFSYHCMPWRLPPETGRGFKGMDLAALGIPTEQEYLAAYCRRTGRAHPAHWDYYMAYNMWRLAAILQGIMGRVVDGTAASEYAAEMGAMARGLAELAWAEAEALTAR